MNLIEGFPLSLTQLRDLKFLDLSYNKIESIPDEIGALTQLERLVLIGCSLKEVPEGLFTIPTLREIVLDCNHIESLPGSVERTPLYSVSLNFNNFTTTPFFIDLEAKMCSIPTLKVLDMHANRFGKNSEVIEKFGQCMVRLQSYNVFQDNISEILPPESKSKSGGLYLGGFSGARNRGLLEDRGVKYILVAGSRLQKLYPNSFKYHQIFIVDEESEDLSPYFDSATDFINEGIKKGFSVYVHCAAGVSRSASMVIAYLIKYRKMGFDEAFALTKAKRNVIHPNISFVKQLQNLEKNRAKWWDVFGIANRKR